MSVSYDVFTGAFLDKITEFNFPLDSEERSKMVDGYMRRAISIFRKNNKYDLSKTGDDDERVFNVDIPDDDLIEIADIISEGMVAHWIKPYLYKQENLENLINPRDFSSYSPERLTLRIGETHKQANRNFINMIREYSYNHGDLTTLHL